MNQETNHQEILTAINAIKSQVEGLDNNKLSYEIWGLMPNISQEMQLLNKGDNKENKCYSAFCKEIDSLMNNISVVKAKIILRNGRNRTIGNSEITLKPQYINNSKSQPQSVNGNRRNNMSRRNNRNYDYNYDYESKSNYNNDNSFSIYDENNYNDNHNHNSNNYRRTRNGNHHRNNNQNQNYNNNNNNGFNNQNFSGFLQLMGFDLGGLDGTNYPNDNMGNLGAVLAIRDKMKDDQYIKERERENYNKLLTDNAKLETELTLTKQELGKANESIEDLEDNLIQAEYTIQEFERLNPNNSILGVTLSGLGVNLLQGLVKKNAGMFGRLLGIDKNTFLGMIEENENEELLQSQQQHPNAPTYSNSTASNSNINSVEIEEVDDNISHERKQANNAILTFCNSLSEKLFIEFYQLLTSFAQNPQSIILHNKWEKEKQAENKNI